MSAPFDADVLDLVSGVTVWVDEPVCGHAVGRLVGQLSHGWCRVAAEAIRPAFN